MNSIPDSPSLARNWRALLGALFLSVTVLLCLGNQTLPLIDRDEPRFAEASREMMQTRNWIVPHFNQTPRYDKPPLIYWMQVACYKALGDNEFASRLPAALCTAATCVLLALWGAAMGSHLTGLRAAVMYALCVQVFMHGRAAVADPPMVLCVVLSAWLGWRWLNEPKSSGLAFAFWTTLAFGFLAKGPIAWVPIGMVGWSAWSRKKGGLPVPGPLPWSAGSLWMLAIVALWGIPALLHTRGEFAAVGLGQHVVGRSLVSMEGHGASGLLGYIATLPLYFLTVFPSFAPWSFWLPAALRAHLLQREPQSRYLLSGVVLTFVIFSLSRTKLPHYTLPAFPFLALLLATWWEQARPARLWNKTAAWTAALFVILPLALFPWVRTLSLTLHMTSALAPQLAPDTAVALGDYREPSMVWALRSTLAGYPEFIGGEQAAQWLQQPGKRIFILTEEAANQVPGNWTRIPAEGWNFAKGKYLKLVALCSPAPAPEAAPAESTPARPAQ